MRSPTTILLTLACTLTACGGDGVGPVDSGVPPEKFGKDLTADEEEKICLASAENLAGQNSVAELKNFSCVLFGLTFAALGDNTPEACESAAQMCRDGAGEAGDDDGGADMCTLDLSACDAPVVDIEACLTERNEAFGKAVREASCDDAGKMPTEATDGPACSKIKATCPGI